MMSCQSITTACLKIKLLNESSPYSPVQNRHQVTDYSTAYTEVCSFIHIALRNHPILKILNLYSSHFKYVFVLYVLKVM